MDRPDFLEAHLNVYWLRPECALWDAIASTLIAQHHISRPSLDLGSGNGIFSFITAGGSFTSDYDWYRNVDPRGFWENKDIYDVCITPPREKWLRTRPNYQIDCAFDHKMSLLAQAKALGFYEDAVVGDANKRLPLKDNSYQTIFSNILYWLDDAEVSLREVRRLLRPRGRALLCLQDHRFKEYCLSYQWESRHSEILRLLNRGRSQSSKWTISYSELKKVAARVGFDMVFHSYYLSPLTLTVWDVGLRPLSPVLIKMVSLIGEIDRTAIKKEWIETVRPFLRELFEMEGQDKSQGGYHFAVLERK